MSDVLRNLITVLTEWHDETHTVRGDHGPEKKTVHTEPLLHRLEHAAIDTPGGAGKGSAPSTRTPINPAIVELRNQIRHELVQDYQRLGGDPQPWPLVTLAKAWFIAFDDSAPLWAERLEWEVQLGDWEAAINDLFDPPVRVEIKAPCFMCRRQEVTDVNDDGDRVKKAAVMLEYRRESVGDAQLMCRACNQVLARGIGAVELSARHAGYCGSEDTAKTVG